MKRLKDEVNRQTTKYRENYPDRSDEHLRELLRSGLGRGDAKEAWPIVAVIKRQMEATGRPEIVHIEVTRALALAVGDIELVLRILGRETETIW